MKKIPKVNTVNNTFYSMFDTYHTDYTSDTSIVLYHMQYWQCPGNSKIFDTPFNDIHKSSQYISRRSIAILEYIRIKSAENNDGYYITKDQFHNNIMSYLEECDIPISASMRHTNDKPASYPIMHFYRPLLFYGLLEWNAYNGEESLRLSYMGEKFLHSIQKNDYFNANQHFIELLISVRYPNIAIQNEIDMPLFPFRILFKLLLEHNMLSERFITEQMVYITRYNDLSLYMMSKNLNDIGIGDGDKSKFYIWAIKGLVSLGYLDYKSKQNCISINNDYKDIFSAKLDKISFESMFINNDNILHNRRKVKKEYSTRDHKLPPLVKERDKHRCQYTNDLDSEVSLAVHHIIPIENQKNIKFKVDVVSNMISLNNTTHANIHKNKNFKIVLPILNFLYDFICENGFAQENGILSFEDFGNLLDKKNKNLLRENNII